MSDLSHLDDPYPFESDDDIEIRELDLESVDAFADQRITVSDLAGASESWRYGHVIVDEAQDLSPMQWRMVMRRVRGRSITIVGDLAQRSGPLPASSNGSRGWEQLLPPELAEAQRQDLTVNYRSPAEIHALAVAVLAEFAPDVTPSTALRSTGLEPEFAHSTSLESDLGATIDRLMSSVGGQVAVIGAGGGADAAAAARNDDRVRFLTPVQAKGLEFDAVVLLEPGAIWDLDGGPSQLYIALTRATQRLVVLYTEQLPPVLTSN